MHYRLFLGAVAASILTTEAAPKGRDSQNPSPVGYAYNNDDGGKSTGWRYRQVRRRYPFTYNGTNTTVSQVPATSPTYLDGYSSTGEGLSSHGEHPPSTACGPSSVLVSTTTLKLTIYVTEEEFTSMHETTLITPSTSTSKGHNETGPSTTAGYGGHETPDTDDNEVYYPHGPEITATASSEGDHHHTGTLISGNSTAFSAYTTVEYPHGSSASSFTTARYWNTTSASSSRQLASTGSSSIPSHTANSFTTTDPLPNSSKACVIDTTIVPVTTASLIITPSAADEPTRTVSEDDAPTGTPESQNRHCGVHGLPMGNYFLARFVENSSGVPVTAEGCYQFCSSVMEAAEGCQSYRFYPERGINAPRCDLYASHVAYALDEIEDRYPDIWFDLECGSPKSERWANLPGWARLRELGLE